MNRHLTCATFSAVCCALAAADTIWVDASNPACPGSGTAADPFCAIQDAVDAAAPFDTVLVLPGLYVENVFISVVPVTLCARKGAEVTTIQGIEELPVVTVFTANAAGTVVEGFTITGGKGFVIGFNPFHTELAGGGVFSNTHVTVRDNVIEGNGFETSMSDTWTGYGGGIAVIGPGVGIIEENVVRSNTFTVGGGIYYAGVEGRITGNVIEEHTFGDRGAGMVIDGSAPLVSRNVIRDNISTVGAGVAIGFGAAPLFVDNVVTGNHTDEDEGGGLLVTDAAPVVRGNAITGNFAVSWGGGIFLRGSAALVADNLVEGNRANSGGGGIWAEGGPGPDGGDVLVLDGNEVAGNLTFGLGGGIAASGPATIVRNVVRDHEAAGLWIGSGAPSVTDNLVVRNGTGIERAKGQVLRNTVVDNTFDGITVEDDATPLIHGCIVRDNGPAPANEIFVFSGAPDVRYCNVRGGHAGPSNIDADPQFVDAASDDYRLLPGSPCTDAGHPADLVCGLDAGRRPRRLDGLLDGVTRVDIGAYELGHVDLRAELLATELAVQTTGTPGLPVLMVIALEPGLHCVKPGPLLFDPLAPWVLLPWGVNPTVTALALPPVVPVPSVVLQALALGPGSTGNLSRAEHIVFP